MNFKTLSLSVMAALAIASAPAYAITDAEQAMINDAITAQPAANAAQVVAQLIADNPTLAADITASVVAARPGQAADALTAALAAAPEAENDIIVASFVAAPNNRIVMAIISSAAESGVAGADITAALIDAGLDPTLLAQATAAGTPNAPTPGNTLRSRTGTGSGSGVSAS